MPKSPANTDYESVTSDIYPEAPKKNAVETARKFVRMTGVSRNLSLLLLDEVKTDPLVQAAIQRHGMAKVQAKVVNAIRSAQNAYSGEWSEMLAGVYLRHIDEDAMKSILSMREASPFFMQLIDEQDSIAAEVKAKGGAIFAEARARVQERLKAEF
ncbi:MAG: hypothetical protein EP335_04020 [Alphaproteobacteria bacterium]|nr:MAG: hypothetical protein EP335_04020 [Alphaproteobacteria bacterium]